MADYSQMVQRANDVSGGNAPPSWTQHPFMQYLRDTGFNPLNMSPLHGLRALERRLIGSPPGERIAQGRAQRAQGEQPGATVRPFGVQHLGMPELPRSGFGTSYAQPPARPRASPEMFSPEPMTLARPRYPWEQASR